MNTHRIGKLEMSPHRLAADLVTADGFFYHDSYSEYVCGRWPNCMLWNSTGTVEEKYVSHYDGLARRTAYGAALPYISELIENVFDVQSLRFARLVQLTPKTVLIPHRDFLELGTSFCRIHVPLRTDPACWHGEGNVVFGMSVGEVWFLDASKPHTAASFSDEIRTHLMLDFAYTDDLGSLVRVEINREQSIPAENIIARSPLTRDDEDALRALHRLIDLDNYRDILALLIRKYFRRQVPVSAVFDWMLDIVTRSGDTVLLDKLRQFKDRCLIHRND